MKRPDKAFLKAICACPNCGGNIQLSTGEITCHKCHSSFLEFKGSPVLLSERNPLFKASDYTEQSTSDHKLGNKTTQKKRGLIQLIKRNMPSKSINLVPR